MTLSQVLRIAVVSGLIVVFWVWIDPAFAVVLGVLSIGVLSVANRHPKPHWARKFWAYCIDRGRTTGSFPDEPDPATMEI